MLFLKEMAMKNFMMRMAALLFLAAPAFAQFGITTGADLVFTPLTPCRIVDTRVAGGTIPAGTARGFKAWGASFAAQGGDATDCGIPQTTSVAALALNLVAAYPAADGWIAAYPFGGTLPNSSSLNYLAGAVVANGATVKVSQTSLAFDWNLHTVATTHFIADVLGYYSRPKAVNLSCSNPPEATLAVAPGVLGRLAIPACATVNSWGGGSATGYCSTDGTDMVAYGGTGECAMKNMGASSATITAGRRCCGVPGR
jgi:hypothetical protein